MLSSLRLRTRSTRRFSSYAGPTHPRKRRIAIASSIASIGFATVYATREGIREETEKKPVPLSSLLRSYMVYSMCSMPLLIDWSPAILSTLSSIPGVRQVTEFVVRHTFFSQASYCHQYFHMRRADFPALFSLLGEIPLRNVPR